MTAGHQYRLRQRGQAIVLIAIMLALLVGMAALAIDGSRAYAMRRDLQAAADAAALAAGDNLQQTGSYTQAEGAAATMFGVNMRLYPAPSCAPGYGAPPLTVACTYSDGTALTQVVSWMGPGGSRFAITGSRALQLQFARILSGAGTPTIEATASAGVNNLLYAPTLAALSQAGCGGVFGSAVSVTGGGTLSVIGDLVSNGSISLTGGASVQVAGDIYDRCQSPVPGAVSNTCYPSGALTPCTAPDVAGVTYSGHRIVDPAFPPPSMTGGSQGLPGNNVVIAPGIYSTNPDFSTSVCYFLSPGVYDWEAGYTNAGGFVSNQLKPPDEPSTTNNTVLANQMWNTGGVNCAGATEVAGVAGANPIQAGTWAMEVTAVRTDTYAGVSYKRESAPSVCRTVQITSAGQVMQVQISNVPGATSYNVYVEPPPNPGCAGPFGYAGNVPVVGTVQNNNTEPCPAFTGTSCSLGNETAIFDSSVLGSAFTPNASAAADAPGAYPPAGETAPLRDNLPNQNPARAAPPGGDRANENQCDTIVGAPTTCPGPITPGAVEFYIPSGGCLNATTAADNFLFSGYQDDWLMVYEPGASFPPANACSNVLGAAADSAWVGEIYTPSAALTVDKAATFRTEATGGLMANTLTFSGQLPEIIGSAAYQPVPPASRLTA